ncbi:MAG: hypothetical protein OXI86_22570 [Candidatus Poribacteria bacterium]|nr:hypothetical protein [Candidatus Poribacteria bacterium]
MNSIAESLIGNSLDLATEDIACGGLTRLIRWKQLHASLFTLIVTDSLRFVKAFFLK